MFKIDETILYGNEGVCKIVDIMKRNFRGKEVEYYVLKSVDGPGITIYVPTDNQELISKMKKTLSIEEIYALIHSMPESQLEWIANDNVRKERYKGVLKNGDRQQLVQLIRTLYLHQQKLKQLGKKFHATDEKILKEAEKILYHEFAYVLNIQLEEVVPFICEQLEVTKRKNLSL